MTAHHPTATVRKINDITGRTFGRWTVVGLSERRNSEGRRAYWTCRCECGVIRDVLRSGLVTGVSQSCGCLHRERATGPKRRNIKRCARCSTEFESPPSSNRKFCTPECAAMCRKQRHGMTKTRLHHTWCGMKTRCQPGNRAAPYYAERGIGVCPEWSVSFEAFRDWAIANGYRDDLELDRIDSDRGYSPDNCRWATRTQQMQNTRKRRDAKTSRFKGVSWQSSSRKWRVQLIHNKVHRDIGLFDDEEEAARAYDAAAIKAFGEFSHINFKE